MENIPLVLGFIGRTEAFISDATLVPIITDVACPLKVCVSRLKINPLCILFRRASDKASEVQNSKLNIKRTSLELMEQNQSGRATIG